MAKRKPTPRKKEPGKASTPRRAPSAEAPAAGIFVFKVALQARKSIWRRIAMRGDQSLDDLHEAIFEAFDRYDEHLYSFYFPRLGAKGRARLRDAIEYTAPFAFEEPGPFGNEGLGNAAESTLASLGLKPRQTFFYLFDFGDSWWHEATVEEIKTSGEKGRYPRMIEKHGESPPQYPDIDDE
jgi:hypothetical protein